MFVESFHPRSARPLGEGTFDAATQPQGHDSASTAFRAPTVSETTLNQPSPWAVAGSLLAGRPRRRCSTRAGGWARRTRV